MVPKQLSRVSGLALALGLAMFIVITGIDNQQSYSFMHVADTAMMFPVLFAILMTTAYFPFSPLPEKALLRLMARYFKSAEYLMSTLGKDPALPLTRVEAWRKRYHARQVGALPRKLVLWSKMIDPRRFPGIGPREVQSLVVTDHDSRVLARRRLRRRVDGADARPHPRRHPPGIDRDDVSMLEPIVAGDAMQLVIGPEGGTVVAIAILISISGAMNGNLLAGPRVPYAMAQDRLFFQQVSYVHPGYRVPTVAIVLTGLIAGGLTLIGTFEYEAAFAGCTS